LWRSCRFGQCYLLLPLLLLLVLLLVLLVCRHVQGVL
jgi:hypothetical protein